MNIEVTLFCQNFCYWLHWKLSKWQVSVQPMRNISIKIMTFLFNSSPPGQNGRHFADDTFKCIFFNENVRISIKISLKFVPKGLNDNKAALVGVMAWSDRRQAITWTNADPVQRCIYAALSEWRLEWNCHFGEDWSGLCLYLLQYLVWLNGSYYNNLCYLLT